VTGGQYWATHSRRAATAGARALSGNPAGLNVCFRHSAWTGCVSRWHHAYRGRQYGRVLADIDANHGNRGVECLRHSVLLGAPSQHSICWWGQEHGRTIPLAVIGVIGTFCLPASNVRRCTMMHWRWRADHSRTTKFTNRPGTAISLTISLPASSSFTRRSAFIRASSVSAAISASATILCRVRPFS